MSPPGATYLLHDGERLTVRVGTPELLEVEAEWAPVAHRPPMHFHPAQDERFEVSAGELTVEFGGRTHVLHAGDSVDIPRGVLHRMWNSGDSPAQASWQVRPALRTENFFRRVHELRASGHHGKGGMLTPLGGALMLRDYPDVFRMKVPGPAVALLARLARMRGYPE